MGPAGRLFLLQHHMQDLKRVSLKVSLQSVQ